MAKRLKLFNVKSVIVFGTKYKVILKDMGRAYGECDRTRKTITINSNMINYEIWNTFYHELFHAISTESGMWQAIDDKLEQISCENFAKFNMEGKIITK